MSTTSTLFDEVEKLIRSTTNVSKDTAITPSSRLIEDIGCDSSDILTMIMALEDLIQAEVDTDSVKTLVSVQDVMNYISLKTGKSA